MPTKAELYRLLKEQLAKEYNCTPEDFDRPSTEHVITVSALHPERRRYSDRRELFSMATVGGSAVITADERLHPFLREWVKNKEGHRLFEAGALHSLAKELERYGASFFGSHHMFLPDTTTPKTEPDFEVKWFYQGEMEPFRGDGRFPNAIGQPEEDPDRPDMLGAAAIIDGKMAGLAGCSADSDVWWQIGLDVLPEYQGRGIGSALAGLLKEEVLRRGKIPFYGAAAANLRSQKAALRCGFFPAWVEIEAQEEKR